MITNYIRSIESEYEKANRHWLNIHASICACLAAISFLLEVFLFFILDAMDMVSASAPVYVRRYVVIPTGMNLLILLAIFLVRKKYPKRQMLQAYSVSLGLAGICFVLFTIHSIFPALYFLFAIPLMFSCIYGNYLLTTVTAVFVFAARIIGDVVISWDSEKSLILDSSYNVVNFALSLMILAGFYAACMILIYFVQEKRHASIKKETERVQFRQGMIIDHLTSLYNRTALNDVLAHLSEDDIGMVCAMIEADHLLEINDILGHLAGDEYLRGLSDIIRSVCGQHLSFRYSGSKFCVLFTSISQEEAKALCRRICREAAKIVEPGSLSHNAAVSFGLSVFEAGQSSDEMIRKADENLSLSKQS
ncbi:MAG: GGDEF domain-containing protein [Lachnospiraceae bacterium]|nr:GGDEF domain-containing protein [Lachnospiraceae bacterium]